MPLGSASMTRGHMGNSSPLRGVALLCLAGGVLALGLTERWEGNGKV